MSEQRLTELLREAADPVPPPRLAGAAWHAGRRRRRTARLAGVAAAAVVAVVAVVGAMTVASRLDQGPPADQPAPSRPTESLTVNTMPPPIGESPAPVDVLSEMPQWRAGPLPTALTTTAVTPLSADPVERAQALYQPYRFEPMEMTPVFVLGTDGRARELDGLELDFASDADGNLSFPLRTTSLSPDGTIAAFPQPDRVVLVDLRTGRVYEHELPGYLEHVVWMPGGTSRTLLVGDDARTMALLLADDLGSVLATDLVPVSPWDVAAVSGTDGPIAELRNATADAPVSVRQWRRAPAAEPERPVLMNPDLQVMEWDQRGWLRGDTMARNAYLQTSTSQGEQGMAVVDHHTGQLVRMLRFAGSRQKSCCQPLGWLDDGTVLLDTDIEGVLSWDLRTGELYRISEGFDGVIAIRDGNP